MIKDVFNRSRMMELDMKSRMRFAGFNWFLISIVINLLVSFFSVSHAELWQKINPDEQNLQSKSLRHSAQSGNINTFENALFQKLNKNALHNLLNLDNSGREHTSQIDISDTLAAKILLNSNEYEISLPLPDGRLVDISIVKDSILPPNLAAKYSQIHTYRIVPNKEVFSGKLDFGPNGLHAMLQMFDGEIVFIDPTHNLNEYAIYQKSSQLPEVGRQHSCGVTNESFARRGFAESFLSKPSLFSARAEDENTSVASRSSDSLKNYTIAVATTGEYSAKFGGSLSGTMAAIVTTLNRVNQILERDLGIRLNLVENNDLLINTDAASDPFTEEKLLDLVFQNQEYIDTIIGNANYDIGHLFTTKARARLTIALRCCWPLRLPPNVGNSGAYFLLAGDCVRAISHAKPLNLY